MQTVYILIGLPGSGKTTYAKELIEKDPENTLRISMDDILQMVSFYRFIRDNAPLYREFEFSIYITALVRGFNVVVDRTNVDRETRKRFILPAVKVRELANLIFSEWQEERMSLFREPDEIIIKKLFEKLEFDETSLEHAIKEEFRKFYIQSQMPSLFGEQKDFYTHLKRVKNLKIVGVFFDLPIETCIKRRVEDPDVVRRGEGINWEEVILRLAGKLEEPEMCEGFDELIRIKE